MMSKRASHWKRKRQFWVRERQRIARVQVIDYFSSYIDETFSQAFAVRIEASMDGRTFTVIPSFMYVLRDESDHAIYPVGVDTDPLPIDSENHVILWYGDPSPSDPSMAPSRPYLDADTATDKEWEQGVHEMIQQVRERQAQRHEDKA